MNQTQFKCNICLKQFVEGDTVMTVQQATDEEGKPIEDGPIYYYHIECLGKDYVQ